MLTGVRCAAGVSQVEPISATTGMPGARSSTGQYCRSSKVLQPTSSPVPASTVANGSLLPVACSASMPST